mmetsp:Transcript_31193/g.43616  ORF Transcript_31193/g.43616 Transcript_31193/m.43616 type:complete len:184 (-) Transcript_31193:168-719(-)
MGKKGQAAAPEAVEDPTDDEEEREVDAPLPPEAASKILESLDWQVCVMPSTRQRYFYSKTRRQARVQPPYHSILGLEEANFRNLTKDDLWKAFFEKRVQYKRREANGSLSEELENSSDQVDWDLVMEAFHVLSGHEARSAYEQGNLANHAQRQLLGLRVMHEARVQEEQRRQAKEAVAVEDHE